MLPTFVIGLREGLEAALIVSIIATFLRQNGVGLRAMWIGVGAAVALSIAVGVVLEVVQQHLPQAQQEGMETVIGAVAVVFVTGMILWMRTHARSMKRDLETAASSALGSGTGRALAVMAFLAVLREGFETSVFLLSTFQAATSTLDAAGGAVLGIVVAVGIGVGIYSGGVRLNLARFFKVTGVFLVFVAAGLVLNALRTAHEAGWLDVGQGRTLDLSWLAPAGDVRTALISGVLGIPADPRVVELLGWACYLVPVLLLTLWPAHLQPSAGRARQIRLGLAAGFVVAAVALMTLVRLPGLDLAAAAPLKGTGTATLLDDGSTATLALTGSGAARLPATRVGPVAGTPDETSWRIGVAHTPLAKTLTLSNLLHFTGQRVPVGLDASRAPGPYRAQWKPTTHTGELVTRDGAVVSGQGSTRLLLTLTGGGLSSPRVITVDSGPGVVSWRVDPAYTADVQASLSGLQVRRNDALLCKWWFPTALLVAAAVLGWRARRRPETERATTPTQSALPSSRNRQASRAAPGAASSTP